MVKRRKLTKKQKATVALENERQLQAFEAFSNKFTGLIFQAKIIWFSGTEGVLRGLNGEGDWPIYACNIKGAKTRYPETACVTLAEGQIIDAEIKVSYGGNIAISHTPGILDQARWAALDKSKLAFMCDEEGKAITGLFKTDK